MSAIVALVLWAVLGALGFGWRSWLQRRHTGSTGFRGIHGRTGSAEWVAGIGFVVAPAVAVVAPVLQCAASLDPHRHEPPARARRAPGHCAGIAFVLFVVMIS